MLKNFIVCLFLFFQISIYAQNNSIYMAGVELKIGMQKKDIKSKIDTSYYKITEPNDGEYLMLWEGNTNSENYIGMLRFDKNNRSIFISRSWGASDSEASMEFARTLFNLIQELNKAGDKKAEITTVTFSSPGLNSTEIRMTFKTKEVIVSIASGSNVKDEAIITEVLSK